MSSLYSNQVSMGEQDIAFFILCMTKKCAKSAAKQNSIQWLCDCWDAISRWTEWRERWGMWGMEREEKGRINNMSRRKWVNRRQRERQHVFEGEVMNALSVCTIASLQTSVEIVLELFERIQKTEWEYMRGRNGSQREYPHKREIPELTFTNEFLNKQREVKLRRKR